VMRLHAGVSGAESALFLRFGSAHWAAYGQYAPHREFLGLNASIIQHCQF
jgi:hypothetical protein